MGFANGSNQGAAAILLRLVLLNTLRIVDQHPNSFNVNNSAWCQSQQKLYVLLHRMYVFIVLFLLIIRVRIKPHERFWLPMTTLPHTCTSVGTTMLSSKRSVVATSNITYAQCRMNLPLGRIDAPKHPKWFSSLC